LINLHSKLTSTCANDLFQSSYVGILYGHGTYGQCGSMDTTGS